MYASIQSYAGAVKPWTLGPEGRLGRPDLLQSSAGSPSNGPV